MGCVCVCVCVCVCTRIGVSVHVRLYAKGTALYTDAHVVNETHCELLPVIARNAAPFRSMSVHPSMSEHVCVCVCL